MIDFGELELRVLAQSGSVSQFTSTGRVNCRCAILPLKEIPSMSGHRYLDADQRKLSALLFSFYHNAGDYYPGARSNLTDTMALRLAGDPDAATSLINAVATVVCPPDGKEFSGRPIIDQLLQLSVFDQRTRRIDSTVLWAHAFAELKHHSPDVSFDHEYHETDQGSQRPGIQGQGITVLMVNGAIMAVLIREGLEHYLVCECFADTQDNFGWVYCDKED